MIRFPHDVRGWLTEAEGTALAVFAAGKRVLEIGAYCGKSTVCLAQAAAHVDSVDPFDGRATPEPGSTFAEFKRTLDAYAEGRCPVEAHVGTMDQIGPQLAAEYDLVFVDGAHDYGSVRNDVEWALRLLRPTGLVAFHDYRRPQNPGVDHAVDDLVADGGALVALVDTLALVKPPRELVEGTAQRRKVVMAMPHRGWTKSGRPFWEQATMRPGDYDLAKCDMSSSVLELNFNRLWCEALNLRKAGFTHFVMVHDDVVPDPGWLDVLMGEIDRFEADVVSAVVPIKSAHGLTSTALGHDGRRCSVWRPLRRLTMHEVHDLPETFCRADVPLDGPPTLFINTGCWIADLRKPWAERCVFRNVSRNLRAPDGRWKADCLSEYWAFSCDLSRWGARVYATRKAALFHEHPAFHNRSAWGMWDTDEEYLQRVRTTLPLPPEAAAAV